MSGFGLFSAGTGAFGLGTPTVAPAEPTGTIGSRWINAATRDYEIDPGTGNLKQMPSVRQQVLLAIATIEGSATSSPRFGVAVPNKMGTTFEAECKNACRSALNHLTSAVPPIIRINNMLVVKGKNSRAEITIDFTDLITDEDDRVTN